MQNRRNMDATVQAGLKVTRVKDYMHPKQWQEEETVKVEKE